MGEAFLRRQAHGFKNQCDAAYNKLKVPTLLTAMRPDISSEEFTCECSSTDVVVEPKCPVVVHANGGPTVDVLQGNRVIAHLCSSDAENLRAEIDCGSGFLKAEVQEVSSIGNYFTIRIVEAR